MQSKVAAHQELERWRSQMSNVVVGCQISKARALEADITDRYNPVFELLAENLTGSWHIRKTLSDFQQLSRFLKLTFPVEAGHRGHRRILPSCPANKRILMILSSPAKMIIKLRQAVDKYCRELLMLPPYISRARVTLDFFLPKECEVPSELPEELSRNNSLLDRVSYQSSIPSMSVSNSGRQSIATTIGSCRLKCKHKDDLRAIEYDPSCTFNLTLRLIKTKFNISEESVMTVTFIDEDSETVLVDDREDLYAAVSIFGRRLILLIYA